MYKCRLDLYAHSWPSVGEVGALWFSEGKCEVIFSSLLKKAIKKLLNREIFFGNVNKTFLAQFCVQMMSITFQPRLHRNSVEYLFDPPTQTKGEQSLSEKVKMAQS